MTLNRFWEFFRTIKITNTWLLLLTTLTLLLSVLSISISVPVTFAFTGESQYLTIRNTLSSGAVTPGWYVDNFELYDSNDRKIEGAPSPAYLFFRQGSEMDVEYPSDGLIKAEIHSEGASAAPAYLLSVATEAKFDVPHGATIRFLDPGNSHVRLYPIIGAVSVGRTVRFDPGPPNPVLLSGTITIIGHQLLGHSVYTATRVELAPGDTFSLADSISDAWGFFRIQDGTSLEVVFRAVGRTGQIRRFGSPAFNEEGRYDIGLTVRDRVLNDPTVYGPWATFGFLSALYGWKWRKRG